MNVSKDEMIGLMLLRNPIVTENMSDQPYHSMMLIAPFCIRGCAGCHNNHLQKERLSAVPVEWLIDKYQSNPFFEGVTVSGLDPYYCSYEWWDEFDIFVELATVEKVTIYTGHPSPFRVFPDSVKEVYWKVGSYEQGTDKATFKIGGFEILLASNNQKFLQTR
jgi:hypothetical protein